MCFVHPRLDYGVLSLNRVDIFFEVLILRVQSPKNKISILGLEMLFNAATSPA